METREPRVWSCRSTCRQIQERRFLLDERRPATCFFPRNVEIPWRGLRGETRSKSTESRSQGFDEREHRARNALVIIANLLLRSTHRDPVEYTESITVNSSLFLSFDYLRRICSPPKKNPTN